MSYTTKECIGCGRFLPLPPKTLCRSCKDAIREHPLLLASKRDDIRQWKIADVAAVPGIILKYNSAVPFAIAMSEFLKANGSKPIDDHEGRHIHPFRYRGEESCFIPDQCTFEQKEEKTLIVMTQEQRTLYTRLMYALGDVIREAVQVGQEKGQNLLFGLNDGSISFNDFNEKLFKAQSRSKF